MSSENASLATSHPTPSTPIELDRTRNLRVNFNALCLMEERSGRSILDTSSWSKLKMKDVRFMLFASLRHEDPDLTESEVGRLLHIGNLPYVMERITKAWTRSISGVDGGGAVPLEIRATLAVVPTAA